MCHDKYHTDPDLRAITNRLVGLPLAQGSEQRERCMTISRMLLDRCALEGLLFYLEAGYGQVPSGEVHRLTTKLKAVRMRMAMEAHKMLSEELTDDETPF